MKKELKEWVKSRYKKGDYYYRVDWDEIISKVSAIDRTGIAENSDQFTGRWEKVVVDLRKTTMMEEYAVAYRLYELQDKVFDDWFAKHELQDEAIEDDITSVYHKGFYIRSPYTQRDFDWWDEKCYVVEGVFEYEGDPDEWIKENPNREDELNELAYHSVIRQMLDNWSLLTYDKAGYACWGKVDKGDLLLDWGEEIRIALPADGADLLLYDPDLTERYVINIPLDYKAKLKFWGEYEREE